MHDCVNCKGSGDPVHPEGELLVTVLVCVPFWHVDHAEYVKDVHACCAGNGAGAGFTVSENVCGRVV